VSAGGQILFLVCGTIALVAALLTVSARSPLRAAVALLVNILSLAGLFLTLHAHMLGAIQVMVYAGAVIVLFVFAIMLIGPSAMGKSKSTGKGMLARTVGAGLLAMVVATVTFTVGKVDSPYVDLPGCVDGSAECQQFGGVGAMSDVLFSQAVVPFELVSALLLVAIIAAVAVARGRSAAEKAELEKRREASEGKSATNSTTGKAEAAAG
jgi:NADH-quinone oxidoreductase subunit J